MASPDVECGQMWPQLGGRVPVWPRSTEVGCKMSCPSAVCCAPSPPQPLVGGSRDRRGPGYRAPGPLDVPSQQLRGPARWVTQGTAQTEQTVRVHVPAATGSRDQVGQGAPAAAQPVNGSPHLLLPHLTTRLQNNSLPGALPGGTVPAWLRPAGSPTAPGWGLSPLSWAQGRAAQVARVRNVGSTGTALAALCSAPKPHGMEKLLYWPRELQTHARQILQSLWSQRQAGDITVPTGSSYIPVLLGRLRHKQTFPAAWPPREGTGVVRKHRHTRVSTHSDKPRPGSGARLCPSVLEARKEPLLWEGLQSVGACAPLSLQVSKTLCTCMVIWEQAAPRAPSLSCWGGDELCPSRSASSGAPIRGSGAAAKLGATPSRGSAHAALPPPRVSTHPRGCAMLRAPAGTRPAAGTDTH